jgi:hypothetical protein
MTERKARAVVAPQAPLCQEPSHDALLLTEALKGELVDIDEDNGEGWSRARLRSDGYVGWLPSGALGAIGAAPTHRVSALRALAFPVASFKLQPVAALPFGCRVTIARFEGDFALTSDGQFLPVQHLAPIGTRESDFVAVAERFLATPYLWGGKTSLGIDCSGLVQIALNAIGVDCPRDSDMQEAALGAPVDRAGLRRGDLLFWKGHVAIARDATTILHANSHHMAVAIETTAEAVRRTAAAGSELKTVRRLAL